jgi:hypothetical protein
MSERERQQAIVRARSQIARTMSELHRLKEHSTPSGWKQAAELIVELGKIRERLEHVEK